jgi:hypothetical protein
MNIEVKELGEFKVYLDCESLFYSVSVSRFENPKFLKRYRVICVACFEIARFDSVEQALKRAREKFADCVRLLG